MRRRIDVMLPNGHMLHHLLPFIETLHKKKKEIFIAGK